MSVLFTMYQYYINLRSLRVHSVHFVNSSGGNKELQGERKTIEISNQNNKYEYNNTVERLPYFEQVPVFSVYFTIITHFIL